MSDPRTPARQPAHQPEYTSIYARSYADRNLAHLISSNPATVNSMKKRYGRYLAGFGSESMSGATGYDPAYQGQHVYDLEKEDDTFGSGIFDPKGRGGTSNANMGIFAGHYSLPGYLARDVPFTVMNDVTDITDDAEVVSIPAGGLLYVANRGELQRRASSPPTWRPAIQPPGWTRFDQPYVSEAAPPVKMPPQFPTYQAQRQPARVPQRVYGIPEARRAPHLVPQVPSELPVGYRSIVQATQQPVPIDRAVHPVAATAPDLPMDPQVPLVQTVNVATENLAIDGFGNVVPPAIRRGRNTLLRSPRSFTSRMPPSYRSARHVASPGGVFGQDEPAPEGVVQCEGDEVFREDIGACGCPDGTVNKLDAQGNPLIGVCAPEDKPISALHLALAGLLVGAGVGLFVSVTKGGPR